MSGSIKKVVIVDDSKLIQSVLNEIFDRDHRFQVVGIASDPHEARTLIKQTDPDVVTLDVEMPKMNGIAFLRNLMRLRPTPVVMISTLTAKGASVTLEALELGAIDFIEKPADIAQSISRYAGEITEKVFAASQVSKLKLLELQQRLIQPSAAPTVVDTAPVTRADKQTRKAIAGHKICAIGGSTGGLEALSTLLRQISFNGRETLVVCLHLPAGFTASYANRLDKLLPITVKEGEHGEQLVQGTVYIAPGGKHMQIAKRGGHYVVRINDEPPVNRHKPSVDVLFDSVSQNVGASAIGVILTGMGNDGAQGLLNMAETGCITYAQDEATSVVWGMPGSAVNLGAVKQSNIQPLKGLAHKVMKYYR